MSHSPHHDANRPLVAGIAFIAILLLGYVLHIGADILVPLAVAVIIWYLINALSSFYSRIPLGRENWRLSGWITMPLSILSLLLIVYAVGNMVGQNFIQLSENVPSYQTNIENRVAEIGRYFGYDEDPLLLSEVLEGFDYRTYISSMATSLVDLGKSTGLIVIYVIFLLLEQRVFPAKFEALVQAAEGKPKKAQAILAQIQRQIQTYIIVKTIVSLATGGVSYLVLIWIGVDYAGFWAFLIFLLNYIPTIGSLIAVIFPTLMAFLQFDTFTEPVLTLGILTAIQILFGNLIEPRFMGNTLNLTPLVIILSLALWGSLWGIVGMFLCVPLTVIALIALSNFSTTRWIAVVCSSKGQIPDFDREEAEQTA